MEKIPHNFVIELDETNQRLILSCSCGYSTPAGPPFNPEGGLVVRLVDVQYAAAKHALKDVP